MIRKIFSKIRFLPLTIFAATLMLTVRVGDIWEGIDTVISSSIRVAQATAQTADQAPAEQAAGSETEGGVSVQDDPGKLITDDPTLLSPAEIEILLRLAERRDELAKRQRELDAREGLLRAAEIRIERKVAELESLKGVIEARIQVFDKQQEEKLGSLVKIYESMKPKDAARIFEELEMGTLLEVAERMKERKLAPVMAELGPERAREMTVELRALRELPRQPAPLN